ncbi:hypothetical protein CRE_07174 [Caenorhabditis remanei]|uniref:Uncharacterized protein n=1 Tax=Caenorhabditis remanei TaxID=31234 RepID=E3NTN4_CAERE|nr:hypothetical protein CRE_07174 [Caenorhabditis remanei]
MQENPLNDEIGQEPNLIRVERGGEYYYVLDRSKKTRDIPLTDMDPFGAEDIATFNSDGEEEEFFDVSNYVWETELEEKEVEAPGEDEEVAEGSAKAYEEYEDGLDDLD